MSHPACTPRRRPIHAVLAVLATILIAGGPVASSAQATSAPLTGIVIALDPGHNGGNATHIAEISKKVWIGNAWKPCNTVGTTTTSGATEHRFNFRVASAVKTRLEALDATVYLTRTSDDGWGPCVNTRGRFGEKVGAALLVSIHADGASSAYHGFVVMKPGWVTG